MVDALPLELSVARTASVIEAARECEARVFFETYGNTREQLADEYGPYEVSSVFIAVSESGGDVVGASRLILPSAIGLKTLDDVARPPWSVDGYASARSAGIDPMRALDLATLGVRRSLGGVGRLVSLALGHALTQVARVNSLADVIMIVDARARRVISSIGCDTFALPGTRPAPYLGSPESSPVWFNVARMLDTQRRDNHEGFRLVGQGVGFDGIRMPTITDYAIPVGVPALRRTVVPAGVATELV